jgi:hypothetical protein
MKTRRPVLIETPFPTIDDVAATYGMSKARVNRILKLFGVTRESLRNGHDKSHNGTARKAKVNGSASTQRAKKPSRARKHKLGSANR